MLANFLAIPHCESRKAEVPVMAQARWFIVKKDENGRPVRDSSGDVIRIEVEAYEGKTRPLAYLAEPQVSNIVHVTSRNE